jgi:hypothetical protein
LEKAIDILRSVLATRTAELHSPLQKDEVEARLTAAIDSRWKPFGSKPVVGVVRESRVWFRQRPGKLRNSFQTVMFAQIEPEGAGTLIRGRSGMAPAAIMFVIAFQGVAFALLLISTAVALTGQLDGRGPPWWNWLPPLGAVFMLVIGVAMGVWGRHIARHEHDFLVDFLAETVEAKVVER